MTRAVSLAARRALFAARVALSAAPAALAALAAGCLSKPGYECTLTPITTRSGPQIGTTGGSRVDLTDCGDRPAVGAAFWLTRNPQQPHGERTTILVQPRCAALSYQDGVLVADPADAPDPIGGSSMSIDGPFAADCPAGHVAVGLDANLVTASSLLSSLAVVCQPLDLSGAPTGERVRILAVGTGPADAIDAEARCDPGEVLHGFQTVSGAEIDQLSVRCARAECALPGEPAAAP